jgi:hypothetical protein
MSRADHTRGAAALAAREAMVEPSRPEPPPVNRGEPVTPPLLAWLRAHGFEGEARAVEARDAFGREKYGQPLMTLDGRDPIEDARQELADALQYIQRAAMLGADLTPLAGLLDALCARAIDAQRERVEPVRSAGGRIAIRDSEIGNGGGEHGTR